MMFSTASPSAMISYAISSVCFRTVDGKTISRVSIVKTEGEQFLDIASGTGHIVHRVMRKLNNDPSHKRKSILATDISPKMLTAAQRKDKFNYPGITYRVENAYDMTSIADASIDVISFSFAMKITDRSRILKEVARVLKPGGVFFCLEAARIPFEPLHRLYLLYMDLCLPVMAAIATSGDRKAPTTTSLRGIHNIPAPKELAHEIESYGFTDATYKNLSLGIVALHRAIRKD